MKVQDCGLPGADQTMRAMNHVRFRRAAYALPLSPCGRGCLSEAKAGEGAAPIADTDPSPVSRFAFAQRDPPSPTRGEGKKSSDASFVP